MEISGRKSDDGQRRCGGGRGRRHEEAKARKTRQVVRKLTADESWTRTTSPESSFKATLVGGIHPHPLSKLKSGGGGGPTEVQLTDLGSC